MYGTDRLSLRGYAITLTNATLSWHKLPLLAADIATMLCF
jgi:hypothetical protein